jgi:chitodextrinase
VAHYYVHYSTTPITAVNFDTAILFPWPVATTKVSGGLTQTLEVTGLTTGTLFYFALKADDEVPNLSGMSNVVSDTPRDTVAPGGVADMAAGTVTETSVELHWTAPGDDGATGTVASYNLRYSLNPITDEASFNAATGFTWPVATAVVAGGSQQTVVVDGLTDNTQYRFALKAADEASNTSVLSNTVTVLTTQADTIPPVDVTDLAASSAGATSVNLSWTAPGDDVSTGTVTSYDVRYSTSNITALNFNSATQFPWPGTTTIVAGDLVQNLTVTGLTTGTPYYFAIKAADEVPNWSGISNVDTATPTAADTTAPADVADLAVGPVGPTSIDLTWTAPGDDGMTGTVASYDLRYSTSNITALNFSSATPVAWGATSIVVGGATQTKTVTGLTTGILYYFALKASDEVPNISGMSNVITGTPTAPDITPPADVADLAIDSVNLASADLSWTAPGDDGTTGTVTAYDVRYSTAPITALNFDSATPFAWGATPIVAGGVQQTLTVTGLTDHTRYYFALKAADEVPNTSGMSNVVNDFTDPLAPEAIADLAAVNPAAGSIDLTWTAPAEDVGGTTGTAVSYDIRYTTVGPITTDLEFGAATPVAAPPTPQACGTPETATVSGLAAGTAYWFAIKSTDVRGNLSVVSNSPTATTLP